MWFTDCKLAGGGADGGEPVPPPEPLLPLEFVLLLEAAPPHADMNNERASTRKNNGR